MQTIRPICRWKVDARRGRGKRNMFKKIAIWLAGMATVVASLGSQACILVYLDEPKQPKNLIK